MKNILLSFFILCCIMQGAQYYLSAQTRTSNLSFPLWNMGQVLSAGNKTDTSTANAGLNSLSLRTDKYLNLAAYRHLNNNFSVAQTFPSFTAASTSSSTSSIGVSSSSSASPTLMLRKSRGTIGVESATLNNDVLATLHYGGYGNSDWGSGGAKIVAQATENWSGTAQGTQLVFSVSANGSNSSSTAMTIQQDRTVALNVPLRLSSGGTNAALTAVQGGIVYSTASALAITSNGSTGQHLVSQGSSAPIWSTATYPTTAGTSGKILISDGTNIVSSTATFPGTVSASGKIIIASGSNAFTTSTPAYPNVAGTDNNFLRSDGTNFISEGVTNDIIKGGSWTGVSAADSFTIFEARKNYTITELRVKRVGGTSAYVNVTRTRSGSQSDIYSGGFSTSTKSVNDAFEAFSGGSLQNTSLQAGDIVRIAIRSISGTASEVYIQLTMSEAL